MNKDVQRLVTVQNLELFNLKSFDIARLRILDGSGWNTMGSRAVMKRVACNMMKLAKICSASLSYFLKTAAMPQLHISKPLNGLHRFWASKLFDLFIGDFKRVFFIIHGTSPKVPGKGFFRPHS